MQYVLMCVVFFFKQKTAYEMRISDWSSDVCSSDLLGAVKDFQARYGAVFIKPLHGNGGKAVFRVDADGANLGALVELFGQVWPEPFMIQQFLPSVSQGDKRIVLVDGEVAGAINRKPGDRKSPRLNSSH